MLSILTALLLAPAVTTDLAPGLMRQVAEHWEAAETGRRGFVYSQRVRSGLLKSNGKVGCREDRRYNVAPGETRTEKQLASIQRTCNSGMDSDLIEDITDDLVDDKDSRDGLPKDLFPLRTADLDKYTFRNLGEGSHAGRTIHKIAFAPRPGADKQWKGEVWVDAEDLQPVRMTSDLAQKIPLGVRVFLGTDIKQLGFSATYTRVAPGIWFPATYGTEFQLKVLWGYRRTITLSLESSDFRRTEVQSGIRYEASDK